MLMTATAWIEQGGAADRDAIRRVLAGNLCRCTGYQHIVDAVVRAVRAKRARSSSSRGGTKAQGALASLARRSAAGVGCARGRKAGAPMRGDASSMTVLRPATPKEALRQLARTPAALPLAGGTDLMVAWNLGALNGREVLDLSRLARVDAHRERHAAACGSDRS